MGCWLGQTDLSNTNEMPKRPQSLQHKTAFDQRNNNIFCLIALVVIATCVSPIYIPAFGLEEKNSDNKVYPKHIDQIHDLQATPEVLAQSMQVQVQAFGNGQTIVDGVGNNALSGKVIPSSLNFELRQAEIISRNVTSLISVYDESKERAGALVFRDLLSTEYGIFNLIMYDQKTNSSDVVGNQDPIFFKLEAGDGSTHVVSSSRPIKAEGDYRVEIEIYKAEIPNNATKSSISSHLPTIITYYWDGKGTLSKTPFTTIRSDEQWLSNADIILVTGCIISLSVLATSTHVSWRSLRPFLHLRRKEQSQHEVADMEEGEESCQYRQIEIPQIGIRKNFSAKTFTELYMELEKLGLNTEVLKKTDLSESELEDLCYAMKQLQMAYETAKEKDPAA